MQLSNRHCPGRVRLPEMSCSASAHYLETRRCMYRDLSARDAVGAVASVRLISWDFDISVFVVDTYARMSV